MRQGHIAIALSFRHYLSRCDLGGLPVLQLKSVLEYLLLTQNAMPAVLLVRFLELLERRVIPALM
jgi:hypothetical protein